MVERYDHKKLVIVIKIIGRIGNKGQITQVRVRFIHNSHKTLVRNIKGSVRLGDIIYLEEPENEA
ncbi:40S ribosomal protein S28 (nucleomorph) [Lotharella oceanica]|uniref:40S ribosomal protein S28 n=1 Tax=Lotharella oceanica TaxID=641309 RepID=A0A060DBZ5_9EUKA|nr:40S ribosomal protein S28 [Lotharella oceanica]